MEKRKADQVLVSDKHVSMTILHHHLNDVDHVVLGGKDEGTRAEGRRKIREGSKKEEKKKDRSCTRETLQQSCKATTKGNKPMVDLNIYTLTKNFFNEVSIVQRDGIHQRRRAVEKEKQQEKKENIRNGKRFIKKEKEKERKKREETFAGEDREETASSQDENRARLQFPARFSLELSWDAGSFVRIGWMKSCLITGEQVQASLINKLSRRAEL